MFDSGLVVIVDDIIIISGCYNLMLLVLMVVCKLGDIVVVEFFCYYGLMQMLCGMGVKVIEILIDLEIGISVEVLELVLEQWLIKGIILVLNCNNLLGFIMLDVCKWVVFFFVQCYDIVIFEDDVYGELVMEYLCLWIIYFWDIDG